MHSFLNKYKAYDCNFKPFVTNDHISLTSEPGQDHFHIHGLHTVDNLPRILCPISGDFTLQAKCSIESTNKFDAAGICIESNATIFKFGIEDYSSSYRIVSVLTRNYSDEAVGVSLEHNVAKLAVTRGGSCISCYVFLSDQWIFQRAFQLTDKEAESEIKIGFFTQSPFSMRPVSGQFYYISLCHISMPHTR